MYKKIGCFTLLFFCLALQESTALENPLSQLEQMTQNAKQSIEASATNTLKNNDNQLVGRKEDEGVKLSSLANMGQNIVAQANKLTAEKIKQFT